MRLDKRMRRKNYYRLFNISTHKVNKNNINMKQ